MRQRTWDIYQNSSREKIYVVGNSYFINCFGSSVRLQSYAQNNYLPRRVDMSNSGLWFCWVENINLGARLENREVEGFYEYSSFSTHTLLQLTSKWTSLSHSIILTLWIIPMFLILYQNHPRLIFVHLSTKIDNAPMI